MQSVPSIESLAPSNKHFSYIAIEAELEVLLGSQISDP